MEDRPRSDVVGDQLDQGPATVSWAEVQADPAAAFAAIRAEGPVVWNDPIGMWMAAWHAPTMEALRDSARFSSKANRDIGRVAEAFLLDSMASADPPAHARLRGPVRSAFTVRAVANLEARVIELVDEMRQANGAQRPDEALAR